MIAPDAQMGDYRNVKETIKIDRSLLQDKEIIVLRINDNSMSGEGLNKDDYAFIKRQSTCRSGQIVAVLFEQKVVLRKYSKRNRIVKLTPSNKRFKPISLKQAEFKTALIGVLVNSFRQH